MRMRAFSIDWRKRLPILGWMPHYSLRKLQSDVIAGVTVGLMVIPQALAYANIAELPPQYGLYSSFMGGFVYCFLGSSKDITQGPTAIMSLMVATYSANHNTRHDSVDYAIALSFLCGLIWLLMGLLSLGFIVRIMPLPVISGFTSTAALTIAFGQFKHLLGLSNIPREFFPCLIKIFSKIGGTNQWDVVLSVICIALLEAMRYMRPKDLPPQYYDAPPTRSQKCAHKFLWIICTARNAIIVFASGLVALAFYQKGLEPFTLTGNVKEGLPGFKFPSLKSHNGNKTVSTLDMIADIGPGFVVIPIIGFIENIVIAQAFARKNHYEVDPTQELITIGVANIASSFFSGYPITGSFSRTAVNEMSGVATQLGGIFTGCVVLLALSVLTPFFKYIPKASLASIIIMALVRMVDFKIVKRMWRTNRIDLLPFFATFLACFYQLDIGILCGVVVALLVFLYRRLVPKIEIQGEINGRCHFKLRGGLTYIGIEYFTSKVKEKAMVNNEPVVIILDCSTMFECDFTVAEALLQLSNECEDHGIRLIFYDVPGNVQEMLLNAGLPERLFQSDLRGELSGLLKT
ncbi:sodium-independent sulfate anion transporter-like [Dendronephthya gigantea]|uniref:sodium-independent sulfate anion transporter-like n=1 Tax=Dendronephthya gigantea TaxID=151771 RepID=UPI00106A5A88|nr:sodium-independent sulfate anion transporter-like [Dendronephthya gigantea]